MITRTQVRALPKGLTISEAAKRLRAGYQQTRNALLRYRYRPVDERKIAQLVRVDLARVDWTMSNIDLHRAYGLTRERWRQLREREGKPKVESRGRPKALQPA